jgi:ZIP family zinc transporter
MTGGGVLRLLAEAVGAGGRMGLALTAAAVLAGHGAVESLERLLERQGTHSLAAAGAALAAAVALHNVPEGMVIGAAFASGGGRGAGGLALAGVIALHNVPEGVAVAGPLRAGNLPRRWALAAAAATGAPTVAGAALGYRLGTLGPVGLAATLGFASGAMLYVVFGELLPEALTLWQSRAPARAAVTGSVTGLVMAYA